MHTRVLLTLLPRDLTLIGVSMLIEASSSLMSFFTLILIRIQFKSALDSEMNDMKKLNSRKKSDNNTRNSRTFTLKMISHQSGLL